MFDVAKFERKLQTYHTKESIGCKDCKNYLLALAHLTRHISKDAKSYAAVALITKKWITGFKPIFGKLKFNKYNSIITVMCFKLLKCFRQYEPKYSYQFYCDWRDIIHSSTSSKRAETFITHIREFEYVVEHLQASEKRWDQFVILGILRVYTKGVKYDDIKGLKLEGCDAFLDIIQNIILLHHHKQPSIRMNNTFLNDLNSKCGNILSFQPYKILYDNFIYIVTDYDLWIDFNVQTKVITFVALSVVDKTENVYGVSSTAQMNIVSNQDNTISIKNHWHLSTKKEFFRSDDQLEIVFCFSSRVHNSILESKLNNVFDVIQLQKYVLSKNSFLKTVLGVNTSRMADESILSSQNEIRLVGELEKLQIPEEPKEQIIQSRLNRESNNVGQATDMIQTVGYSSKSDVHYFASINSNVNESGLAIEESQICSEKTSGTPSRVVNKRFLKRRRDQVKQGDSNSSDGEFNTPGRGHPFRKYKRSSKRVTNSKTENEQLSEKLSTEKTSSHEPSTIKQISLHSPIPNLVVENAIPRTVTMDEPMFEMKKPVIRSQNDKKCIKILADEILLAGDDLNHKLANIPSTSNKSDQQLNIMKTNNVQCLPDVPNANISIAKMEEDKQNNHRNNDLLPLSEHCESNSEIFLNYDYYRQCWALRKFVLNLRKEEQERVEENVLPIDDDIKSTDVFESVSQRRK